MKLSNALFLLALGANAACIAIFYGMTFLPNGSGADFIFILFIFPPIWLITFVVAIMILVTKRFKAQPDNSFLRVVGFLLCTPIPMLAIFSAWVAIDESGPELFSTTKMAFRTNPIPGKAKKESPISLNTTRLTPFK